MKLPLLILVALAINARAAEPTKIDPEPGWPMASGPFGNYTARRQGLKLVDDPKDIRAVWHNTTADLGWAKGSASYLAKIASRTESHPGAFSGPIIAAGKVFASSFKPSGTAVAKSGAETPGPAWNKNAAILADDFVVAVDFATGKEVWRAVEKEAGLNFAMSKRGGWGVAPVYCRGMVVSLGTGGMLRGYDAETGAKRWETKSEPYFAMAQKARATALAKQEIPDLIYDACLPLLVVGGTVVVPQFDGVECTLVGVDALTGAVKWTVPKATSPRAIPAIWRHEGKEYVIASTAGRAVRGQSAGAVRCIDGETGKVLWKLEPVGPNFAPLIVEGDMLLIHDGTKLTVPQMKALMDPEMLNHPDFQHESKSLSDTKSIVVVAAYRLGLDKAERVWSMPDTPAGWYPNWPDCDAMRHILTQNGLAYLYRNFGPHSITNSCSMHILDVKTGAEIWKWVGTWEGFEQRPMPITGQSYLVEDLLINYPDAAHGDRLTAQFYRVTDKSLTLLPGVWKPDHKNTTAYQTFMETPIADGRIVMRSEDGGLHCYDLRKEQP